MKLELVNMEIDTTLYIGKTLNMKRHKRKGNKPVFIVIILFGFLLDAVQTTSYQATGVIPAITTIPSDIPNGTTTVVITDNRQLSALAANVFSSLSYLTYADLSSNNLSTIHHNAFQGTQLETLILYDNWFVGVPPIDHISSTLISLNLRWNSLEFISSGSFLVYPNLQILDISKNALEWNTVNLPGLTDVLSTLEKLDLSDTKGPAR